MAASFQRRVSLGGLLCLLAALVCLAAGPRPALADPTFPALTGRVVDDANLLSPEDKRDLAQSLKQLEEKSSDQVVVVTLPSLQGYTIEDYGYRLGRHWGIGTKELNNGVLLIVLERTQGWDRSGLWARTILTDALSRIIIDNAILPRFRSGDFSGGIKDGVENIELALTGDVAELERRASVRRDADQAPIDWFTVLFFITIFILIMYLSSKGAVVTPGTGRGGRSSWGGGGGGWSGGGGGGGGGGFSGGGGSFGGGGSSGSW